MQIWRSSTANGLFARFQNASERPGDSDNQVSVSITHAAIGLATIENERALNYLLVLEFH
jgi:hypothetical protein